MQLRSKRIKLLKNRLGKNQKKINLSDVDLEKRMGDAFDILKSVSEEQPSKNEIQLYSDLLATKLRSFNERTREIIMHNIDNLVFNAKMNNYENSSYQANSYYDQPMSTLPRIPPIQNNTVPSYTNISAQDKVHYQPAQISSTTHLDSKKFISKILLQCLHNLPIKMYDLHIKMYHL